MSKNQIFILFYLLINTLIYSQEKYVEKFPNGNIKIESFIVGNTLDSIYKEYYENGKIKQEGFFKNCEYETNRIKKYMAICGAGNVSEKVQNGKRHGEWKSYYKNGNQQTISNYYCDFMQGNFYSFYENGTIASLEFYYEGDLQSANEYFENGFIESTSFYKHTFNKKVSQYFTTTQELEYYEDGKVKIQREIIEKENDVEIEYLKEFFPNGFLKLEVELVSDDKNGIYREYYENGNVKYEGKFKDDKPIEKQYFYHENGKPNKIEYWKKGKLLKTELK